MDNTRNHQRLVDDILYAVGSLPDVRLWPRHVGGFAAIGDRLNPKFVRYGIPGESDLQGIIKPSGRYLCIEVKTGSGKLSKAQRVWRDMIVGFGGLHIVGKSVDQVIAELQDAIKWGQLTRGQGME